MWCNYKLARHLHHTRFNAKADELPFSWEQKQNTVLIRMIKWIMQPDITELSDIYDLFYWWRNGKSQVFFFHVQQKSNSRGWKRMWRSEVRASSSLTFPSVRLTWEPRGIPSDRFPLRDINLSNLSHNRGLFKKQLGAYTKQFAGSLTPQTLAVEWGLSALIYHTVASTRQHN